MTGLFIIILFVSLAAAWLDRSLAKEDGSVILAAGSDLAAKIDDRNRSNSETVSVNELTQDALRLFQLFFDRIYGPRMFSWRRILTSFASTVIGLAVILIAIGPSRTLFGISFEILFLEDSNFKNEEFIFILPFAVIGLFLLNIIPDFVSLAETRLILKLGENKRVGGVLILTLVDLLLTTLIFFLVPFLILVLLASVLMWAFESETLIEIINVLYNEVLLLPVISLDNITLMLFSPGSLLPFFLTTFITSLFWLLFVSCFFTILIVSRITPVLSRFLVQVSKSDQPALTFSTLANVFLLVIGLVFFNLLPNFLRDRLPESGIDQASARLIEPNTRYRGDFISQTNYWLKLPTEPGNTYRLQTSSGFFGYLFDFPDTVIETYLEDGSYFDSNDDCDHCAARGGFSSDLILTADSDELSIRISEYGDEFMPASDFEFVVYDDPLSPPLRWEGYTPVQSEVMLQSGISYWGTFSDKDRVTAKFEVSAGKSYFIFAEKDLDFSFSFRVTLGEEIYETSSFTAFQATADQIAEINLEGEALDYSGFSFQIIEDVHLAFPRDTDETLSINPNDQLSFRISNNYARFEFSARPGETYRFHTEKDHWFVCENPYLRVWNSDGEIIASNDDRSELSMQSLISWTASEEGNYILDIDSAEGCVLQIN